MYRLKRRHRLRRLESCNPSKAAGDHHDLFLWCCCCCYFWCCWLINCYSFRHSSLVMMMTCWWREQHSTIMWRLTLMIMKEWQSFLVILNIDLCHQKAELYANALLLGMWNAFSRFIHDRCSARSIEMHCVYSRWVNCNIVQLIWVFAAISHLFPHI